MDPNPYENDQKKKWGYRVILFNLGFLALTSFLGFFLHSIFLFIYIFQCLFCFSVGILDIKIFSNLGKKDEWIISGLVILLMGFGTCFLGLRLNGFS